MAFQRYLAIPGTVATLTINSLDYPATTFTYETLQQGVPVSTASSMPYSDIRRGGRSLIIHVSGLCRVGFNPFLLANPPYIGSYANISIVILANQWKASAAYAYIQQWAFADASDGAASYTMTALGNFTFTNITGNNNN